MINAVNHLVLRYKQVTARVYHAQNRACLTDAGKFVLLVVYGFLLEQPHETDKRLARIVGGGYFGFGLSGYLDCHVFVLNSGDELALVDPGMGMNRDFDTILDHIRDDGLDPAKIRKLILTHYHCDHIGAAAEAQKRLDVEVYASAFAAPVIREADEKAVALDVAKAAGFLSGRFFPAALSG